LKITDRDKPSLSTGFHSVSLVGYAILPVSRLQSLSPHRHNLGTPEDIARRHHFYALVFSKPQEVFIARDDRLCARFHRTLGKLVVSTRFVKLLSQYPLYFVNDGCGYGNLKLTVTTAG
jgi:hypothetical protein